MCGIAGIIASESADELTRISRGMARAIAHRGPDDEGIWIDSEAGVGLAHRRLSIVDLSSAGHQPMISHCGRFVLIINGEIYNHAELRAEFSHNNAAPWWCGHSDSETLLAAISHWGLEQALKRCTGMFALALWDRSNRTLSIAIDRLGEKPLYYGRIGRRFVFASELSAIKVATNASLEIDRNAVCLLLRHNYILAPHSIFQGIHKLEPGQILSVKPSVNGADVTKMSAYWSSAETAAAGVANPFTGTPEDTIETLDSLLKQSIKRQMVADVPVGAFLSGGIDSSAVVAIMQQLSTSPVETFAIGFEDKNLNEAPHARLVAQHLGTKHHELIVSDADARAVLPQLASIYAEPFADASQIPTSIVCNLAKQNVTVTLSGDGGDELFGGYNHYHQFQRLSSIPRHMRSAMAALLRLLPSTARTDKFLKLADVISAGGDNGLYRALTSHWQNPAAIVAGIEADPTTAAAQGFPNRTSLIRHGMDQDLVGYLPGDILTKVDRAAMAVALETRLPLLDHNIVAFAASLPMNLLHRDGQSKWPLRQLIYRYAPRDIVDRPKMGFAVPLAKWLRGPLRDWAEDLLAENKLKSAGIFHPKPIRQAWQEHLSGRRNFHYRLWSVLMFQAWFTKNHENVSHSTTRHQSKLPTRPN